MAFNSGASLGEARGRIVVDVTSVEQATEIIRRYAQQIKDTLAGIGGGGGGSRKSNPATRTVDEITAAFQQAQREIQRAQAEIQSTANRFQTLRIGANVDTSDIENMQQAFQRARQPIQDARLALAQMREEAGRLGSDASIEMFADELSRISRLTGETTTEVQGLSREVDAFGNRAQQAATGARGYFARLRAELERINEQGLGRNLQELGFSLAPLSAGAGAAAFQGISRALDLEEVRLGFDAITESQEESTALFNDLRQEAQRFGLPVIDTLNAMQRLAPVVKQTGGDIRDFVSLAARLASINPTQGVEGAVIAISEALSGSGNDFVSLTERFNISRAALRNAVQETGSIQAGIDQVLDSYGRTEEVALRFGETGRAAFRQFADAVSNFLAVALTPLLNLLTSVANGVTDFLNGLNGISPTLAQLTSGILGITAVAAPLLIVIGNLVAAFEALKAAQVGTLLTGVGAGVANSGGIGGALAGGLSGITGLSTSAAGAAVALVSVAAAAVLVTEAFNRYQTQFNQSVDAFRAPLQAEQSRIEGRAPEIDPASSFEEIQQQAIDRATFFAQESVRIEEARLRALEEAQQRYAFLPRGIVELLPETQAVNQEFITLRDNLREQGAAAIEAATNTKELYNQFRLNAVETARATELEIRKANAIEAVKSAFTEAIPAAQYLAGIVENLQPPTATESFQDAFRNTALGVREIGSQVWDGINNAFGRIASEVSPTVSGLLEAATAVRDFGAEAARLNFDRARQSLRDLEDVAIQRSRDIDNFNRSLADFDARNVQQSAQALNKLNDDLARIDQQSASRRQTIVQSFQEQEARSLEDHQNRLAEIRRQADFDIQDAAARLDAAGVFSAQRTRDEQLRKEEQSFEQTSRRRQQDYQQQLAELNANLQTQRAERIAAYNTQVADQQAQYQQQRTRMVDDFNRRIQMEDADRVRRMQRMAEDNALADRYRQQDLQNKLRALGAEAGANATFLAGIVSTAGGARATFASLMNSVAQSVNGLVSSLRAATTSAYGAGGGGGRGTTAATRSAYNIGTPFIRTNEIAQLHAGEAVMNPTTAAMARSLLGQNYTQPQLRQALSGGGSTSISMPITVNAQGGNAVEVGEEVARAVNNVLMQLFNT